MCPSSRVARASATIVLIMQACLAYCSIGAEPRPKRVGEIATPSGFERIEAPPGSFSYFMRNLALLEDNRVHLYDGRLKRNQSAQYRVVDLDVGNRDLQQCADAIIRIRAEYFFKTNQKSRIVFHFTSGDQSSYEQWARGYRPIISGSKVSFVRRASVSHSYENFKSYLWNLFTYAGTISLRMDSLSVQKPQIGDFFLQSGSPGHAVLILDAAKRQSDGKLIYLLGQSYMPAQQFHVLRNPSSDAFAPSNDSNEGVWYSLDATVPLETPEWTFPAGSLRRWR
ncbi:MAG: DUF4846 domain-containing protein [Leptospiraceae bacterium]|nr:DUF4846 domain-containing protein [Leptospiraceae bacterium]